MRVTHADRCADSVLSVTALVDPCSILRAHNALPLPARCHYSAMPAPERSDRHSPAEQGAAAPLTPPRAPAWWSIIRWWVPREDVMALCKGMGTGNDKGTHALWGVPPGFGASHKGWHKGHQGQHADKGKPVEVKGWRAHPGHADKGKPVEGKGWGVHPGPWPSDTGLQCKHADKGKPVEGKGGEPEHNPKSKGLAQWKPESGKKTWAEQASGNP